MLEAMSEKAVSLTYKTVLNNTPDNLQNLRRKWERNIRVMEDVDWEAALMHPREVDIKTWLRLIQFKILHRSYYDLARLHAMGSVETPSCLRCAQDNAGFYHTIWGCTAIQGFWMAITQELSAIVVAQVPMDLCDIGDT